MYAVVGFNFPGGNEDISLQAPHVRVLPTAWWLERVSLMPKVAGSSPRERIRNRRREIEEYKKHSKTQQHTETIQGLIRP